MGISSEAKARVERSRAKYVELRATAHKEWRFSMNLSWKWLNELVDVGVDIKEFSSTMTMSGSKVETYATEGANLSNIVVGRVLAIEKHPDADKLVVCTVDVGRGEAIQIVTGAKNLSEGDVVPVALDGSTIAGGTKIKKGKLRGVVSNGMLCSIGELDLTINDFPNACGDGILVLEGEHRVGEDIREAIGYNDTRISFEITPNRPDCLSVIGLAREAAATFGKELKLKAPVVKGPVCGESQLKVTVQDNTLCPLYCAQVVGSIKIAPSPLFIRQRLRTMGIRPINNIVDITNYVMLEYGQPMHAFDLERIDYRELIVRKALEGEKITTLDGSTQNLLETDLIIADKTKPLAIAGVMGGEKSCVTENTHTIVLECANFDKQSIRRTSKSLNLRTESSARFEKGVDINICREAMNRAVELIVQSGGEIIGESIVVGKEHTERRTVCLDCEFINRFLNIDLTCEEIKKILMRVGCEISGNDVHIPTFRDDIKNKEDLAEEIARFYGYNNIRSTNLTGAHIGGYSKRQKFNQRIVDIMVAQGLSEVVTYSFTGPKSYDKLLLPADHTLRECVVIANPLGEDSSVMRTTGLTSMLEVLLKNHSNKNENVGLFEVATEYKPSQDGELPKEYSKLICGMYGEGADFFAVKGIVEESLEKLCVENYEITQGRELYSYHPGRSAAIYVRDRLIGVFGELHPKVLKNYGIGVKAYAIELDTNAMYEVCDTKQKYSKIIRFPAVTRDIALLCDESIKVIDLQKVIIKNSGKLLEKVKIFDIYQGSQVAAGKKSVAFSITLRSPEGTLTDIEINKVIAKSLEAFEKMGIVPRC